MPLRTLRIEVLGVSFTIQTDESPDYLHGVLDYYGRKAESVRSASKVADPLKAAILAGLYLVDELFRERARAQAPAGQNSAVTTRLELEGAEAERLAARLLERLDRSLARVEEAESASADGAAGGPPRGP